LETPAALDELEKRAWHDFWATAVEDAVYEQRIDLARFGPVQAAIVAEEPTEPSLNVVLGAGTPGAVEAGHLQDALAWAAGHRVDYRVPVTPGRQDARRAERWLAEGGHEQGRSRVKLIRDVGSPSVPTPRGIEVLACECPNEDVSFPEALAETFGMPYWGPTFFFDLPGTEDWRCYTAVEAGDPLAYVAMLIHAGVAELFLAPQPQRRPERVPDGLLSLVNRCVADAGRAGCGAVFAEVEELRAGRRPSLRRESLLVAGFEQAFVRTEWRPPRHQVAERGLRESSWL
jgi:hypothetical protein